RSSSPVTVTRSGLLELPVPSAALVAPQASKIAASAKIQAGIRAERMHALPLRLVGKPSRCYARPIGSHAHPVGGKTVGKNMLNALSGWYDEISVDGPGAVSNKVDLDREG